MWDFDSDVEYDSEYSDGEPYFALKEEVRRGDWNAAKLALDAGENWNESANKLGQVEALELLLAEGAISHTTRKSNVNGTG